MTVQQASKQLLFQLFHIYEDREAKNIADLVMENITEWKRIDRVMNKEVPISADKEKLLALYTEELLAHKPVQYVLQEAWFYGMKLFVDENVLIPRPETEELVDWVCNDIADKKQTVSILDVGTGSGCISLALKSKLPNAKLFACDVSNGAIKVAEKNAAAQHAELSLINCDFLKKEARQIFPKVQVIVSNPPYIPVRDKDTMHENVLLHEPHLALFVEDTDPLVFYKAIAEYAQTNLLTGGAIYVEIHELQGDAARELFLQEGFKNVELRKDLQGKERMIKVTEK